MVAIRRRGRAGVERARRRARWIGVGLGLLLVAVAAPAVARPLRYETSWTDAQGNAHKVRFVGSARRGVVTGVVQLGELRLPLEGLIRTDRTVAGTLRWPDGRAIAEFTGGVGATGVLEGTFSRLGARRAPRRWAAPGLALPESSEP